jgi:uridine kinase
VTIRVSLKFCVASVHAQKSQKKCYNIVVVGVTGAGKTTFCDSLVNFFLGVDFYNDFRYKLIDESAIVNPDKTKS